MNIGFWSCIILVPVFIIMGLIFGILKEKSAKLISGFIMLPKAERELYDKVAMAIDMRNSCFLWSIVMLIGAIGSWVISAYVAIAAYLVWGILFFKEVHLDARKAFQKYRIEQ